MAFDQTDWSTNAAFRARCLRQLHDGLVAHSDELRTMTVAEVGCPVNLTYAVQLDAPIAGLTWVADAVEGYEWDQKLGVSEPFGVRSERYIWREPVGVVGAITPWNFPMQINLAKIGPALGAGNTVVLKAAPDTPWSATMLGRIVAEETDIPAGVLNIITSADPQTVGQQLSEDGRVDMVSFTGSTATGRNVAIAGTKNMKKVFLELGGKSAFVVLDDADMSAAAGGVVFQFTCHAGQACAATTRFVVPRARFDEGVDAVVGILSQMPYGDPTDPATMMGPLVREQQRERVLGYINMGIEEGAKVAVGGGVPPHLPKGYYVEPTVLVNVDQHGTVAQEEIFGPVLVVLPHDGDDDAVAIANNSAYGLSGAVMSGSIDRARAVARRIRTGTLSVNGGVYYGPDVPFGGYRQSGIGREMGVPGLEEYLEIKAVAEPA
jgi:aldehyde dehydrogenase (NAD+)